ncbi:polyketide synthase [Fusarium tjaetaba]|uniref:Polyketide synthase n=1 Tax=Fusarium tjaetaba TaxID=1567544 RepID=A0A8H5RV59_9HYPO|nr:polyketide synthase [Fusarium tjaetaba]KAF5641441.1 polyketide synthase [Fusarium tjaetaba]
MDDQSCRDMDADANIVNSSEAPHRDNAINEQHPHDGERNPVPDTQEAPQIVICGIALRLPGGISNCQDYWDLLYHGLDARRPIPSSRFNINGFNDSLGGKDSIKTRHGYFIEDDLSRLDTSFFSLTKNELERVDPQQRLLLQVTHECLEDAGEIHYRGKQVGCYVGTFGDDWLIMNAKEPLQGGLYATTGGADLMMANRISYEYDFRGPSMVIKTGCSSSAVALHEACRAIQRGDASSAIVGGANMIMTPALTATMSSGEVLAPDASCKTFDAAADGYARAEAITAVYIKPLSDAIRDGNPIRAIVKGTAVNCDGKCVSLVTPNGAAHEALTRKAYCDNGLDPKDTAFVECHGTGTPTGDPIEAAAVGKVFGGEKEVLITSVKPNLGHSEGSAGLSSVIKCVLALEHQTIPPNIKLVNPNPNIPFSKYNLSVPLSPTPFPSDRLKRVSINSFGIGGSNAHVILEAYTSEKEEAPAFVDQQSAIPPSLLLLSANTASSLQRHISNHQKWAASNPNGISDLGFTLATHRKHLPHRAFIVSQHEKSTEVSSLSKIPPGPLSLVFVFSGQGAQWPLMTKELIESDTTFRSDLNTMDSVIQKLEFAPSWNLIDELLKPAETSQINKAELSQPLCTAIQLALVNKFSRLGLFPSAIVGHSSGEIAGAYAAGHISMEEAIIIAYYRGYVTTKQNLRGGMAAVGMGVQGISEYLTDGVVVACENSPESSTISGDAHSVAQVVQVIKQADPDMFARLLKVDMAYHSQHMLPLSAEYQHLIESELPKHAGPISSTIEMFSTVTTELADASLRDPSYWTQNLTSSVKFSTAVSNLLAAKQNCLFLEIGPHSALAGPLRQICSSSLQPCHYISSQLRDKNSSAVFLSAVGKLYQHGMALDLASLFPNSKAISGLPTYPWDHSATHWSESRISKAWRSREYPQHCLLGSRNFEGSDLEPQWRNILSLEDIPWLMDHKLNQDVVFPFAGYIAIAGEAIRQVTQSPLGGSYRLRHVVAHQALLLSDSVEISTSLRIHQLNDLEDSTWYEFTISSYDSSCWTKHCTGQVSILEKARVTDWTPEVLPRRVDCARIYSQLAYVGFVYGPEFRGLLDVTVSPSEHLVYGCVSNKTKQNQSAFTLHPATIDTGLQLLLVSEARGLARNIAELVVPTAIEEVEISTGSDFMDAKAWRLHGTASCVELDAGGNIALRASGISLRALGEDIPLEALDAHAASRLTWLPHIDFVDLSTLFVPPSINRSECHLQEELTLLCIIETVDKIKSLEPCQPHFTKFRDWLKKQLDCAASGEYKLVSNSRQLLDTSQEYRLSKIEEITTKLLEMPQKALTIGLRLLFDDVENLFTGKAATIETLLKDNVLADIYDAMTFDYSSFLHILSHTRPTLRILEVGAGTGGTTETILRGLAQVHGLPAYSAYTFTDVSAGFFPAAKGRFSGASNMDFKVLDVSQNPVEQGFQSGTYDLIVAANVLHATPSLYETLRNIRVLLKPDGMLVMTEVCSLSRLTNFVFGNFSGWWLGEQDDRPDQPYVPVSRWEQELKRSGYSGVDVAVYDDEEPYRHCSVIVASKEPSVAIDPSSVTLLAQYPQSYPATHVSTALKTRGWNVTLRTIGDQIPQDRDVISCMDLESAFFDNISEKMFIKFQEFTKCLASTNVLWLMSPTQAGCSNPRSAQTLGVTRTLRSELGLNLYTLEIDLSEDHFGTLIVNVFEKVIQDQDSETLEPDREYVVHDGAVCVGRYQPIRIADEAWDKTQRGEVMKTLRVDKPGALDTMNWVASAIPDTIMEDEIEVKVHSAGLNFHDVVSAMGLIPSDTRHVFPGIEVSGVVRRLGSAVTGFSIGDRIMSICYRGGFSTHFTAKHHYMHKIPDEMSFEEAATIQCCFSTVIYALVDLGKMRKGTSVLIHSACGGIGLAAIQVAQMMEGEIYATVGNEEKEEYLVREYGIQREHIFHSRDASFLEGVMQQTAGQGVNLVLNSLSGDLLNASWKCVAKSGTLLELGKRDLASRGQLDMSGFLDNRSYCGIDMHYLIGEQPMLVKDVMEGTLEFFRQGKLRALRPVKSFAASDAKQAFRYLQDGQHMGKVVLEMSTDSSEPEVKMTTQSIQLDPLASYLLVGGLGGLGRALAVWLVERGAKHLVFLSRSRGGMTGNKLSVELEAMGCNVIVVKGSVSNLQDVEEAISKALCPFKGVFHLAMVQRDSPLLEMKWEDWKAAVAPKVNGTWNLHQALHDQPLDHFWLASSAVTFADQPGQGNYKSGCIFTESFCQYRHSLGLPASVLSICGIEDVGYLAENPSALRSIKFQGLHTVREKEFLESVEACLFNSAPFQSLSSGEWSPWKDNGHIVMGMRSHLHLDDPKNPTNWRRDRRMGAYHNLPAGDQTDMRGESNQLKVFLQRISEGDESLSKEESIDFLSIEIGTKVNDFLLRPDGPVDPSLRLSEMGLDSLTAIELRRWFSQVFGLQVSVLEMIGAASLREVARIVATRLGEKLSR